MPAWYMVDCQTECTGRPHHRPPVTKDFSIDRFEMERAGPRMKGLSWHTSVDYLEKGTCKSAYVVEHVCYGIKCNVYSMFNIIFT